MSRAGPCSRIAPGPPTGLCRESGPGGVILVNGATRGAGRRRVEPASAPGHRDRVQHPRGDHGSADQPGQAKIKGFHDPFTLAGRRGADTWASTSRRLPSAAVHDQAVRHADTDWSETLSLYGLLERMTGNPMVTLNRPSPPRWPTGRAPASVQFEQVRADGVEPVVVAELARIPVHGFEPYAEPRDPIRTVGVFEDQG